MNVVTHAVVGATIGSLVPWWAAAPLGLVSHAALDMLPHEDYSEVRAAALDVAASCGVVTLVAWAARSAQPLAGAIPAAIPDLEVALSYLTGGKWRRRFPSHSGVLPHGRGRNPWALVAVWGWSAAALAWALFA